MARSSRFAVSLLVTVAAFAASLLAAPSARAAPSWVDRSITLPRLVFAGDVGIGIAHERIAPLSYTGAGLDLEAALGITDSVELGLRTGIRLGDDGKALAADTYARTFFTETYGVRNDVVANPEMHVRWAAYSGRVVEVGLDGRLYFPVEDGARAGIMLGVPLAFHAGGFLRIDTGLYVPLVFTDPASTAISIPLDFWFQVSRRTWLGPMFGWRHIDPGGPPPSHDDLLVGFGVGYQVASAVDLKWMFLAPRVNAGTGTPLPYGASFAVQFRIGE